MYTPHPRCTSAETPASSLVQAPQWRHRHSPLSTVRATTTEWASPSVENEGKRQLQRHFAAHPLMRLQAPTVEGEGGNRHGTQPATVLG